MLFLKNGEGNESLNSNQDKFPTSLEELRKEIDGLGHEKYPFLSRNYSPNSRVPATDFVPFIKSRILNNDYPSIIRLMRNILTSNPGVGIGPGWIDDEILKVKNTNFESYISFSNKEVYAELRALFIIASKGGSDRPFWLTDDIPKYFSWILAPHYPEWKKDMEDLADKANSFIEKMGKDSPYWENYQKLKVHFHLEPPPVNETVEKIQSLSPSAKLHFFFAVSHKGGSLPILTNYPIRSFGIDIEKTSKEIMDSNLLVQSYSPKFMLRVSRSTLLDICVDQEVDVKKSWTKEKLVSALETERPKYVKNHLEEKKMVVINTDYRSDVLNLFQYVEKLKENFKVLCFIK